MKEKYLFWIFASIFCVGFLRLLKSYTTFSSEFSEILWKKTLEKFPSAMAFNFFKSLLPTVKAQEEDLVDPQQELRVSQNKRRFEE